MRQAKRPDMTYDEAMRLLDAMSAQADQFLAERNAVSEKLAKVEDAAHTMWCVLCNVSEGDWTKQQPDWQEAVKRGRAEYFEAIDIGAPE